MVNKIFKVSIIFVFVFSLFNISYANDNSAGNINKEQAKVLNIQVQSENKIEAQNNKDEAMAQSQKNKEEALNESQKNKEDSKVDSKNRSEERKSEVAKAVSALLESSDENGGIGGQVRVIARNQNEKYQEIEEDIEKIEERGNFTKFMIGPNYKEINRVKTSLNENKEEITELENLKDQIGDEEDLQNIEEQINVLKNLDQEFLQIIENEEKVFSLLGWMFKMFSK